MAGGASARGRAVDFRRRRWPGCGCGGGGGVLPEAAGELGFPSRSPNRRGFWGGWNLGEKSASGVELESVAVYRRLWRDNA